MFDFYSFTWVWALKLNFDSFKGEKFYPAHSDSSVSDAREETAGGGFTTETDESLPHSVSLPTMEDLDTDQDNSVPDTPGKLPTPTLRYSLLYSKTHL